MAPSSSDNTLDALQRGGETHPFGVHEFTGGLLVTVPVVDAIGIGSKNAGEQILRRHRRREFVGGDLRMGSTGGDRREDRGDRDRENRGGDDRFDESQAAVGGSGTWSTHSLLLESGCESLETDPP